MKHSDTLRCLLWLLALLLIGLGNLGVQAQPYALSSGAVVTAGDGGHLQATFGQPWSGEVGNGTMQIRLGFWAFVSAGAVSTDVEREAGEQPHRFRLDQNYPNPFNPSTRIGYVLEEAGPVRLTVYNLLGRQVAVLVNQTQAAGSYAVTFDAEDLPSGMYLYRLDAAGRHAIRRMMLLK